MKVSEVSRNARNALRGALNGIGWRVRQGRNYLLFFRAWVHRLTLRNITVIGITGSAGKTTTKDLAKTILERDFACYASDRSKNAPYRVAESILQISRKMRFAVLEMSGGQPGILDWPILMARPGIGVVTVIGKDHYREFGRIEGIAAEKGKLVFALPASGTAILNMDDPLVRAMAGNCRCRIIWVGTQEGADIRLKGVRSNWPEPLVLDIEFSGQPFEVRTKLHGTHLALSVLCALAVGVAAGVPITRAIAALDNALPPEGRMQVISSKDGVTFIRDDWKAPEWSLQPPLEFLKNARAPRKVAVMGTISDSSGDNSAKYRQFARKVLEYADLVVFVGANAHRALRARNDENRNSLHGFSNIKDASRYLKQELRPGDLVLLKGSNKADHLVRLYLDRYEPIECWDNRCGLKTFCGSCSRLYTRADTNADAPEPLPSDVPNEKGPKNLGHTPCAALIVGLGNPGARYYRTPHNIGEEALHVLAERLGASWTETAEGQLAEVRLNGGTGLMLFKPGTMMNRSGPPVRRLLDRLGLAVSQCVVMHDDMDLALGTVRVKEEGGDGGHNGLRSLIEALGTSDFRRIRVGIRSAGDTARARQRVLERFPVDLEQEIVGILDAAASIAQDLVATDPTTRNRPHTGKTGAVDEQG